MWAAEVGKQLESEGLSELALIQSREHQHNVLFVGPNEMPKSNSVIARVANAGSSVFSGAPTFQ